MANGDWYHVSPHGSVLFCIAADPDCTMNQLTETLSLTPRRVLAIIRDLRDSGMLHVRRDGRRHHYSVNLDAPLLHPIVKGYTLRAVMGRLVKRARRRDGALSR